MLLWVVVGDRVALRKSKNYKPCPSRPFDPSGPRGLRLNDHLPYTNNYTIDKQSQQSNVSPFCGILFLVPLCPLGYLKNEKRIVIDRRSILQSINSYMHLYYRLLKNLGKKKV